MRAVWQSIFTPEQDAQMNELRLSGLMWREVAVAMGMPHTKASSLRQRAERQRMPCTRAPTPTTAASTPTRRDLGLDPLPPGHPWALAILREAAQITL